MKPESNLSGRVREYCERVHLINEAVTRIYLKLGGQALERSLAACERTVAVALRCRESEARLLAQNPDARYDPKARPLVSVSAGLAAARELYRYLREREALRSQARAQVDAALETLQPAGMAELKEVLNSLCPPDADETLADEERELVEQEVRLLGAELPELEPAKRQARVEQSALLLRSLMPARARGAEELLRNRLQAALAA
ncbi:hypothetical protein EDM80_10360 [bacterium]|nr:MAG: hypothetical protein EDM80_10360 [bacterium]RIK62057.1 MAG: hypothetical protein DCC64_11110 [Planctomycetota bacterium]